MKDWPYSVVIPWGMGDARNLLMARGVVIRASFDLHLPPVLTRLGDRIAAERHLPKATVVRSS